MTAIVAEKRPQLESQLSPEYLQADDRLQKIAELLAKHHDIANISIKLPWSEYWQKVAGVVASLYSFSHHGIGVGRVVDQVNLTDIIHPPHLPTESDISERHHDCKLPTAVMAYLVREISHKRNVPLQAWCVTKPHDPHVYLAISVDRKSSQKLPWSIPTNDYLTLDFDLMGNELVATIETRSFSAFQAAQVGEQPYLFATTDLQSGLQLYDQAYLQAVENIKQKPNGELLAACHYDLGLSEDKHRASCRKAVVNAMSGSNDPLQILDRLAEVYSFIATQWNKLDMEGLQLAIGEAVRILVTEMNIDFFDIMQKFPQSSADLYTTFSNYVILAITKEKGL